MSYTDYQLPFEVRRLRDVLQSDISTGVSIRRERFPHVETKRAFVLHYPMIHPTEELPTLLALIDTARGAAATFSLTLPDVGGVDVRCDDDGYSYEVLSPTVARIDVTLVEDPRYA